MNPLVQKPGRWAKRFALRALRGIAPLGRKKLYNARLNWREFWHGRVSLHSFPLHIQVGTNLTCNLRCIFCRRQAPQERARLAALPPEQREMSPRLIDELFRLIPYAEIVNLTPYGEPLLFSRLPDLLARYKQLGTSNLALTTNGLLLNEEMARLIVSSGVFILFLSIDSCDPEVYAGMRVGSDLGKVEEGIERVNRWKAQLQSEFPRLILASTFMRRNIEQLPGMVDFAARHNIEEISVQLMEMETPEIVSESLEPYRDLARQMLLHAEDKARTKKVRLNLHLALRNLLGAGGSRRFDPEPQQAQCARLIDLCRFPWYFIYIDTNGDVRPCCYASICWGNLARQDFQSIWNGTAALAMRRAFLDNILPEYCRGKHCRIDSAHRACPDPPLTRCTTLEL
jgi:MoaA/NifB/PqqE/SkfB family radical SAM enzyme